MKLTLTGFLLFALIHCSFAQKSDYKLAAINDVLTENANAVVRLSQIDITIASQRSMTIRNKRVVTVLNENGQSAIDAYAFYDKSRSVKSIEALIYDAFGNEIKKIKKKDFKDQSVVDGGTLFSDSRYLFLEYTPISYPFTVEFTSEIETSCTAFIPRWLPLSNFYTSVEKAFLNVTFPDNLGFKKKEFLISEYAITNTVDTSTQLSYQATSISAQKQEDYSPSYQDIFPKVIMALESFHLEGFDGTASTWVDFGKWYSQNILTGTTNLPDETKFKIKALVGDEKDPIKKAKLIYDFVQQKSRYVSIQVGIGGWKPMLASDVDRLGYGDCKALTNYTKALLEVVDVPSYHTILYGSTNKEDVQSDFVSMQGNHMILSIPNGNHYTWLECTSQDDPFGYQGTFTDDRDVLVIKPEGAEIAHTTIYTDNKNTQSEKGTYSIDEKGNFTGSVSIVSEGSQYSLKSRISNFQPNEKENHYKQYWDNINNLKLGTINYTNDKENIRFTETAQLSASNYGIIAGNSMIFTVNAFNQNSNNIRRIRNRKNPFEIQRGYLDTDEIEVNLPTGYSIDFLPANFELNSKFGEYNTEVIKVSETKLKYKRTIFVKKGNYTNTEYDEYRLFMEKIAKNDNAKIILTKN